MLTHWFISDTHFCHANIIKYCNRPFLSYKDMNEYIINQINALVQPNDILWHLGDVSFGRDTNVERLQFTLSSINCKTINLIIGNHDQLVLKEQRLSSRFSQILKYYTGYINNHPVYLVHRNPDTDQLFWEASLLHKLLKQHNNLIWLHGHTHNKDITPHNICVENTEYKPISFSHILERFAKQSSPTNS